MPTITEPKSVLASIAEAAWERQAGHVRFSFKERRPADHPSRVAWVTANNAWQAEARARKGRRTLAT
jgi:hypothetical protein